MAEHMFNTLFNGVSIEAQVPAHIKCYQYNLICLNCELGFSSDHLSKKISARSAFFRPEIFEKKTGTVHKRLVNRSRKFF